MIKTEFKFGETIEVSGYISRHKEGHKRFWVRFQFPTPIKAIFLGGRKISNGIMEFPHEEDPYYDATEYLDGALVCQYNRNPIKVLLSDVKKIQ